MSILPATCELFLDRVQAGCLAYRPYHVHAKSRPAFCFRINDTDSSSLLNYSLLALLNPAATTNTLVYHAT